MKIAYFDIETWDLKPQFGPVICVSVLQLEPGFEDLMYTFRIDDYIESGEAESVLDDGPMLRDARDLLEQHHMTCGYFSKGFDITHLRTRLVAAGERPLKKMLHMDPIWGFKGWRGLNTMSSKMKHVARFLGLEEKPDLDPEVWLAARLGPQFPEALDEVVERCEADVRITRAINEKVWELGLLSNIQMY